MLRSFGEVKCSPKNCKHDNLHLENLPFERPRRDAPRDRRRGVEARPAGRYDRRYVRSRCSTGDGRCKISHPPSSRSRTAPAPRLCRREGAPPGRWTSTRCSTGLADARSVLPCSRRSPPGGVKASASARRRQGGGRRRLPASDAAVGWLIARIEVRCYLDI